MNTARVGNAFENVVAARLEASGWVVGIRRHRRGGGDILAVNLAAGICWLVECKATQTPWSGFPPKDRQELADYAERHGMTPMLAWRLPGNRIRWVPRQGWPESKGDQ